MLLGLLLVSLLLFFGRPTLGPVAEAAARLGRPVPAPVRLRRAPGGAVPGRDGRGHARRARVGALRRFRPLPSRPGRRGAAVAGVLVFLAPGFVERTAWAGTGASGSTSRRSADATDGADVAALIEIARARAGAVLRGHALELGPGVRGRPGADVRGPAERGRRGRRVHPADVVAILADRVPVPDANPAHYDLFDVRYADPALGPPTPPSGAASSRGRGRHVLWEMPTAATSRWWTSCRRSADRTNLGLRLPTGSARTSRQGREPRRSRSRGSPRPTHRERRRPTGEGRGYRRHRRSTCPRAGDGDGRDRPRGGGAAEDVVRPPVARDGRRPRGACVDARAERGAQGT